MSGRVHVRPSPDTPLVELASDGVVATFVQQLATLGITRVTDLAFLTTADIPLIGVYLGVVPADARDAHQCLMWNVEDWIDEHNILWRGNARTDHEVKIHALVSKHLVTRGLPLEFTLCTAVDESAVPTIAAIIYLSPIVTAEEAIARIAETQLDYFLACATVTDDIRYRVYLFCHATRTRRLLIEQT